MLKELAKCVSKSGRQVFIWGMSREELTPPKVISEVL